MATQETIKKAVNYAKENNIKNIVVATTTGGNLTYLEEEKDLHIVGVTNAYDQGQNQMREEVRKHFEEAGMDVVTAGHALSGAERCFSTYFGGYGPTEIVANTLRMFSQGVKVCVEVSTMALDAGKIPYQEKIVAIAGSGRGADTVVLLTPSYTRSILDTKVHKIIEMPEQKRQTGERMQIYESKEDINYFIYCHDTFRVIRRNCIFAADQWIFHVSVCIRICGGHGNSQCGSGKGFDCVEGACDCGSGILCAYDWSGFDDGFGIYGCDIHITYMLK